MKTYTFLCVRQDGGVPSMELSDWQDVSCAQRRAVQLLGEHESCSAIEVWDDADLCMVLARDPAERMSVAAG